MIENPKYTKVIEQIFNHKLFFDIKTTGLLLNVDYSILLAEIDYLGFDITVNNFELVKYFQIKTKNKKSKTSKWKIKKKLLRPSKEDNKDFNLVVSYSSTFSIPSVYGLSGGVILIEFDVNKTSKVIENIKYYYTDFKILTIFHRNFKKTKVDIIQLFNDILTGSEDEYVKISKSLFIEVTINDLLHLSKLYPLGSPTNKWDFYYHTLATSNHILTHTHTKYNYLVDKWNITWKNGLKINDNLIIK